jgi:Ca-activated chloride channel family protein
MKATAVIAWTTLGVLLSSAAALAIPIEHTRSLPKAPVALAPAATPRDRAHVSVGDALVMDARLGHAAIGKGASGETYLFASVTGADVPGTAAPPLDLAIVIDRSGSMKGQRMENATLAATGAVDRMRDGDGIVVVSFDTEPKVVVPYTAVAPSNRASIATAIRGIRLGGDTCISCGLDEARRELDRSPRSRDRAARMLLLSDGAANAGIRDVPGLRAMAGRMRDRGLSVSTVGVDVDFDERVLGAIATESNGNHHFVAQPSALPAVFAKEFDTLAATLAREAEVVVDLAPGVEVEQVFDRAFRREGGRVVVPLGSFAAKDEKSVLVKLRIPADKEGPMAVAGVRLAYRDLRAARDAAFTGDLSLDVKAEGASGDLDPFVRARVERSTTARSLTDANDLMNAGRFDEARAQLAARGRAVAEAQAAAKPSPRTPAPVLARGFGKDLDDQTAALESATRSAEAAATAAPTSRARKEAAKDVEREVTSNPFR